ncbi:hypothetical protein LEP1GSC016_4226 [Leptospira borgpetersenii serovar Hardjo-bovis str. Sponselee]|uniref:Uncharacterized protein n=7 Tax=Leptospira borgpetersenii TaxID=174 RepID=M3GHW3_LEPBO|nr:hypothetical protein LBBP_03096 [Leptospira borgpetersenii serovar Ballum]EKP14576.1 hypothetical protein LEP1GSC128_1449 [Leptospira borgpetersenii str. 200801926]EKQ92478.1 hypothetical protein LEP1GSC101_2902 [Leptospira borgpetersenii str. UI 09149]EKQ99584.1 hypothetical protein LEP1GSC121_2199 [Leptospira borgpetersenii serovar Castellonis str. 200801910]EMG00552.1 hypothetical protein LEP1GSC123_2777 [Leptospira borgpetersenii str. 200701203]EMJ80823.1 hypothetical protein LEP1GSC016
MPLNSYSKFWSFFLKYTKVMGIIPICNLYVTPFTYLYLRPSTVYSQGV